MIFLDSKIFPSKNKTFSLRNVPTLVVPSLRSVFGCYQTMIQIVVVIVLKKKPFSDV